jgi:hypothetical protein
VVEEAGEAGGGSAEDSSYVHCVNSAIVKSFFRQCAVEINE